MKPVSIEKTTQITEGTPLLQACNLLCERNYRVLFRQLSFSVYEGDILQIAGPNGSGKTSLLRLLSGLSDDFEGDIFFKGKPKVLQSYGFKSTVLLLSHASGIKESLTPRENLHWLCALSHSVSGQAIEEALNTLGLAEFMDTPAYSLSAGQKRRIALARLLLSPAKIWILDEPFTAIDQKGIESLEAVLIQHSKRGGTVILTSHHRFAPEYDRFKVLDLTGYTERPSSCIEPNQVEEAIDE